MRPPTTDRVPFRNRAKVAYLLAGSYGSYAFNGLTVIVSAVALPATDRGIYVGLVTWMTFLAAFVSLGVGPGLANAVRRKALSRRSALLFVPLALLQAVPGTAVVLIAAAAIAPETLTTSTAGYALVFIGMAGVMTSDWAGYIVQGLGRTYFYANLRMAVPLAGLLAFAVILILDSASIVIAVACVALTTWTIGVVALVAAARVLPRDGSVNDEVRAVFRFGRSAYWGAAASSLGSKVDGITVSIVLGPAALSYYALAVSLTTPVSAAGTAVGVGGFRNLATAESRDQRRLLLRQSNRRYLVFAGASGGAMAIALPLVPFILGSEYQPTVHLGWILLLSAFSFGYVYMGTYVLQAFGRPNLASLGQVVTGVSAIAGVAVLASQFGAVGAAVGTVIGYGLGAATLLRLASRVSSRA